MVRAFALSLASVLASVGRRSGFGSSSLGLRVTRLPVSGSRVVRGVAACGSVASAVTSALTIRSSRRRFAARLNSGVRWLLKTLAILLAFLATPSAASGPQFKIFAAEPLGQFMVFGRITDGFEAEMRKAIADSPNLKRVYIESLGGKSLEAMRTSKLLNAHGIAIRVGGKCASACVALWAATDRRELTPKARLGLHAGIPVKKAPGALEAIAAAARQKIAGDMLRHAGFSDRLIAKGNKTSHNSIMWLTPTELASDGVKFTLIETPPNNSFKPTPLRGAA